MTKTRKILLWVTAILVLLAGGVFWLSRGDMAELSVEEVSGTDPVLQAAQAEAVPTINIATPIGWADGESPVAAQGLSVTRFAQGLDHPRVVHTLPNGDVLVTLTRAPPKQEGGGVTAWIADWLMTRAGANGVSPNMLVLLRDQDGDGMAEARFVVTDSLESPSGIAWANDTLYIANHNAVLAFPYRLGQTKVDAEPRKLMDLPPGDGHWMRNIEVNLDATKLYVAVGSVSNIGEQGMEREEGRAAIWEYDLETGKARIFAAGLRNPNGLDWSPWSGELWTTVNERDMLGSDLVPDYLTNVPLGAQYGWPWLYYRNTIDARVEAPMPDYLMEYTRRPVYSVGPHVAALGLVFTKGGHRMGDGFAQGAFVARHGSWNRKPASGYDVVYIAFDDRGNPVGVPVPVLTGFLAGDGTTRGRPTWAEWAGDGSLLISDDTAGIIWRVVAPEAKPSAVIERLSGESLPPSRGLLGGSTATFTEDFARETSAAPAQ